MSTGYYDISKIFTSKPVILNGMIHCYKELRSFAFSISVLL